MTHGSTMRRFCVCVLIQSICPPSFGSKGRRLPTPTVEGPLADVAGDTISKPVTMVGVGWPAWLGPATFMLCCETGVMTGFRRRLRGFGGFSGP